MSFLVWLANLDHRHRLQYHPGDFQSLDRDDHTGMKPDQLHTTLLFQLPTGWSHDGGG
jgi:hypothetical protein